MLFPLLSLSLIALSPTFSESFANANCATFINFINFRVYRNECILLHPAETKIFYFKHDLGHLWSLFLLVTLADNDNICDAILVLSQGNATDRLNHKSFLTYIEVNIGLYGLGYCIETSGLPIKF